MFLSNQPVKDDETVRQFADLIAAHPEIRMARDVQHPAPYVEELTLVEVLRTPEPWAQPRMCWFNCRDYVAKKPDCSIVFGWQIYRVFKKPTEKGLYAFHHAVVRTPSGLLDITPDPDGVKDQYSVFLPDSRVPYDYSLNRHPASLYWRREPNVALYWTFDLDGPKEMQSESYRVARTDANFYVPVMNA